MSGGSSTPAPNNYIVKYGRPTPVSILLAILVMFVLALQIGNSIYSISDEVDRHVYHNLVTQGMSQLAYWGAVFVYDLFWTLLTLTTLAIGLVIRDFPAMADGGIGVLFGVTLLYAVGTTWYGYMFAVRMPGRPPRVYILLMVALVFGSIIMPVFLMLHVTKEVKNFLSSIVPAAALVIAYNNYFDVAPPQLTWTEMGIPVMMMGVTAVFPMVVVAAFANKHRTTRESSRQHAPPSAAPAEEDTDVATERARIAAGNWTDDAAVASGLRVQYGDFCAVGSLSLGIHHGECFGLLGPNGAGKTTSVKTFLGGTRPSGGTVQFPQVGDRETQLGICAQHDTLWEHLTARQHMEVYLALRLGAGYGKQYAQYVEDTLEVMKLARESWDRPVSGYSGGMKRKLAVAIAIHTGAHVVFLDEPSTGMDPFSRRALWSSIRSALRANRCVLLTTHSMEEADAVCSRIGIMCKGRLVCLGNGQHLKNRFGPGYTLVLTLTEERAETLATGAQTFDAEVARVLELPHMNLIEQLDNVRRYALGSIASLAAAYQRLEAKKADLGVERFSLNQAASLEEIFLLFVNEQ